MALPHEWEKIYKTWAREDLLRAWGKLRTLLALDVGVDRKQIEAAEDQVLDARARCSEWGLDVEAIIDEFEQKVRAALPGAHTGERRP